VISFCRYFHNKWSVNLILVISILLVILFTDIGDLHIDGDILVCDLPTDKVGDIMVRGLPAPTNIDDIHKYFP
jgi:hypothetical protein